MRIPMAGPGKRSSTWHAPVVSPATAPSESTPRTFGMPRRVRWAELVTNGPFGRALPADHERASGGHGSDVPRSAAFGPSRLGVESRLLDRHLGRAGRRPQRRFRDGLRERELQGSGTYPPARVEMLREQALARLASEVDQLLGVHEAVHPGW